MVHSTSDRLASTITLLSGSLGRAKALAEAEARIGGRAALGLILSVETALAELSALRMDALAVELAETLPSVCGGAPHADDYEELDPAIFDQNWPAYPDPACDGFTYELGPTPLEVLARDHSDAELERDWDAMFADHAWTDADQLVTHGCV